MLDIEKFAKPAAIPLLIPSDSEDEESGSSSDQEPSKSSEEESTSSSSGKDGDAKVWFSPVLHFFWQTENWT